MAAPTLAQQAQASWQQGQNLLNQDQSTAAQSKSDYQNYSNEATQANQQQQAEAAYMEGAGSGSNQYASQLGSAEQQASWNPQQLSDANKSLFSLNGALNSANTQFNTPGGVGQYGVSAPALAGYESSILNPLQTGMGEANANLGALNTEYGNITNRAAAGTTAQVQSEQNTVTALNNAAVNYQTQAAAALSNMQFYNQLASTQGRLNSQEQTDFAQAQQAYATAQNMLAEIQQYQTQSALNTAQAGYYNAQVVHSPAATSAASSKPLSVSNVLQPTMSGGQLQGGSAIPLQGGSLNLQGGGGFRLQ